MAEKKEAAKFAPKVKRVITVPLVKLNPGEPIYVTFTGEEPRHVQLDNKVDPKTGKQKDPATVLRAAMMETGELVDVIASTVLLSQLDRAFGGVHLELTNVSCLIENKGKRAGKDYNDIFIAEVEA